MIVEKCLEQGLRTPDFEKDMDFTTTFWRKIGNENLVEKNDEKGIETTKKSVEKIIQQISSNPKITQKELAQLTGLSRRGVEKNIGILKTKGIIERIGPDKGGHWEILK